MIMGGRVRPDLFLLDYMASFGGKEESEVLELLWGAGQFQASFDNFLGKSTTCSKYLSSYPYQFLRW